MRLPSPRYAVCLALVALAVMALCTPVWPLRANPGASVSMSANASPGSVPAGGLVSYEVALTNTGDQSANDLAIAATLPSGFSYVPDSAQLSFNNIDSYWPDQAPAISGQSLTWSNGDIPDLAVPARRLGNYYGIHTFVQDYFDYSHVVSQLDKAHELTGNGGYVTELLYPVTAQTTGANNDWKVFVQQACAKQLTPVVRLATRFLGSYWEKPTLDGALARAFGAVVADLRTVLPGNCTMYVQVLNEPNLTIEWGNDWPDPIAYGHFLVQVSVEIRKLYDSHIKILNGVLSPGGNYNNVSYTREMLGVDGALGAWDAWASHPYPANHPATYNIHDGTATYPDLVIDSYILEMRQISKRGRHVYDVLATETGYRLTDSTYRFEGFGPIRDSTRADFIQDAFQNRWTNWPELRASTPYELSDPSRSWWQFDWLKPDGYQPYEQFTRVRDIALKPGFEPNGRLTLTFQARAGYTAGTQTLAVTASASNASIAPVSADVTVLPGGPSPTRTRTPIPSATFTPSQTPAPGAPTATETTAPTSTPTATGTATPVVCIPTYLTSFPVGAHPKGIAVDSASHRLHVGLYDSSRLAIFSTDTQTYGSLGSVDTQGTHSNGVAADPDTGMVYVTNRDSANVSVINGRAGSYVTRLGVGNLPFGVAAGGGRAYVANFGLPNEEGTVSIIDTTNNTVMSTPKIGPCPALAAVANGKGFVVSAGMGNGSGALYALTNANDVASVATGYFAFGAAYLDGIVYVTHRGAQTIAVVDAVSNRILDTIALPGPAYALAVNPANGHLLAVDAANDRLYVLDAQTGSLIVNLPVGDQDVNDGGQGLAFDPQLGRIYVSNYAAGSITVISDCGPQEPTRTPTVTPTFGSYRAFLPVIILEYTAQTSSPSQGEGRGEGESPLVAAPPYPYPGRWQHSIQPRERAQRCHRPQQRADLRRPAQRRRR